VKLYIIQRAIEIADHIISTKSTIRQTADTFAVSKSTVHKDISDRLYHIDRDRYRAVKRVLSVNFADKHLRGGQATRIKYHNKRI